MVTIGRSRPAPNVLPMTRSYVQVKKNWDEDWVFYPYLTAIRYTNTVAPEVGSAELMLDFGDIKREDQLAFSLQGVSNLRDYYCQILIQYSGEEPVADWYGVITDEQTNIDRAAFSSGVQRLSANGLVHLFDRIPLTPTRALESPGKLNSLDWSIPFNRAMIGGSKRRSTPNQYGTRGNVTFGNRSSAKVDEDGNADTHGTYVFERNGEEWNNRQILDYLLKYFLPASFGAIKLTGQASILSSMIDLHDFEGATLFDAINELIPRGLGLGWNLEVTEEEALELNVFTVTDVEIRSGTKALPANLHLTTFTLPNEFPFTHLLDDLHFRVTANNTVDVIEIRGERILVCGTFSYRDGTLFEGWVNASETSYRAPGGADNKEKDQARQADKFEAVYSHHRVPQDWDWLCGNGEGVSFESMSPTIGDDGSVDFTVSGPFWNSPRAFERELPLESGKDYTVKPPTSLLPADTESDYRPLFAAIQDSVSGAKHTKNDKWIVLDRANTGSTDLVNIGVRPLDKELGIETQVSPRHYLGAGHFTAGDGTEKLPELDYKKLLITAAIQIDHRQRIVLKNMNGTPTEVERRITIDVDGAQYWHIAPNTVIDVDASGGLVRVAGTNQALRDGLEKLNTVAAFAQAWYGIQRQAVQIPIKRPGRFVSLGVMLTDIRSVALAEPVRTVVTARTVNMVDGTTVIETGWQAIDVVGLANNAPVSLTRRQRGQIRNAMRKAKLQTRTEKRRAETAARKRSPGNG